MASTSTAETPNLQIGHITAAQNQKNVTANEAFDRLDEAMNDFENISSTLVSTAGILTLASSHFLRNYAIKLTTGTTQDFDLVVPNCKRQFGVINESGYTATVKTTVGGAVILETNERRQIFSETGSNIDVWSQPYDVVGFIPSNPVSGSIALQVPVIRTFKLYTNIPGSRGYARIASSTGEPSRVFNIQKDSTTIGNFTFSPGSNEASVSLTSETTFTTASVLAILHPVTTGASTVMNMSGVSLALKVNA